MFTMVFATVHVPWVLMPIPRTIIVKIATLFVQNVFFLQHTVQNAQADCMFTKVHAPQNVRLEPMKTIVNANLVLFHV